MNGADAFVKNKEFIEVENRGKHYYIAKCYTMDVKYPLRRINKEELQDKIEDKNIITTYCVLEKDGLGRYSVADVYNLNNKDMESAIKEFFRKIY